MEFSCLKCRSSISDRAIVCPQCLKASSTPFQLPNSISKTFKILTDWFFISFALVFIFAIFSTVISKTVDFLGNSNSKDLVNSIQVKPNSLKLEDACYQGKDSCFDEISSRTVQVQTATTSGTGFIFYADNDRMMIVTASHVVRLGNGHDSAIRNGVGIWDSVYSKYTRAKKVVAYFMKAHSDMAIIEIPNNRPYRYPLISPTTNYDGAYAGENVYTVSHKNNFKESFIYSVKGYDNQKLDMILSGLARPGDSGSVFITEGGRLAGILDGTQYNFRKIYGRTYKYNQTTRATYNFDSIYDAISGLDSFCKDEYELGEDYICRSFS